jgi:hypothetical protein
MFLYILSIDLSDDLWTDAAPPSLTCVMVSFNQTNASPCVYIYIRNAKTAQQGGRTLLFHAQYASIEKQADS